MDEINPAVQLILYALMAGAIYGGIRQDLKSLHANDRKLEKATKRAHKRIDKFIDERNHHGKKAEQEHHC